MLGSMNDTQLLRIINSRLEDNQRKQEIVKQNMAKADNLYNAIVNQSNFVEQFKQDIRNWESYPNEPIYFEKYSKFQRLGCVYYKILAKANEHLAIANEDENNMMESGYENEYRVNKASNILTADMAEYSDMSENNSGVYKKRQRHQLSEI